MHYLTSIGLLLALTGLLLIYLLKKALGVPDRLLLLILASFAAKYILDDIYLRTGNIFCSSAAVMIGISTITSCGLYIRYITDTGGGFHASSLLHYLPVAVIAFLGGTYYQGVAYGIFDPGIFHTALIIVCLPVIIYNFFFCIHMLRVQKQLIMDYYAVEPGAMAINWVKIILVLQILEFIVKVFFTYKTFGASENINLIIISNEYCCILETFLLVVFGIWQESITVLKKVEPGAWTSTDYEPIVITRYQQRVEEFMLVNKPFLDPDLTIEKLSNQIGIKKQVLSLVLNKGFNKSFFNYIKAHRIRHVEELLRKGDKTATIIMLAYQSGFNSKTGFNRAFKEITGKTPSEYLVKAN